MLNLLCSLCIPLSVCMYVCMAVATAIHIFSAGLYPAGWSQDPSSVASTTTSATGAPILVQYTPSSTSTQFNQSQQSVQYAVAAPQNTGYRATTGYRPIGYPQYAVPVQAVPVLPQAPSGTPNQQPGTVGASIIAFPSQGQDVRAWQQRGPL